MADFLTFSDGMLWIFVALATVVLYSSIRIAQENERFAVFMMGRFAGYKGPGLVFKSSATRLVRLKVGDIGTVTGHEFAKFGDDDIPIKNLSSFEVGDPVRIDRFDGTEPRVEKTSIAPKTLCPKCGHEF